MKKTIDCFLIGHNEMDFRHYEKSVRQMGPTSGAYRDLNLSFINYRGAPYHATEIFNLFPGKSEPLKMLGAFSATIAYLGSYLNRHGLTFDYVHSFQEEKDDLALELMEKNILTVAITTTYYISVFPILEIVRFIRKYNRTVRIIIGGPFISTQCRTQDRESLNFLLSSIAADVYVNSPQGEGALVNIIKAFKTGSPLGRVNNIFYKSGDGYVKTPILEENNQIAENRVNWQLFAPRAGSYVNLRTAISCPFSCAFCGIPRQAGGYQAAPVEEVEKELDQLAQLGTVKLVHFVEDTINVSPGRFKEILKMMVKKKYTFKWHGYFRCQYTDREMAELMKESGCIGVYLGLESASNQILKNMNKAVTVEKYRAGINLLNEYGILMHGNFLLGFPGETHETAQETVTFIKESGIDFFRVQLWYCWPITPIWKQKDKYRIEGNSFEWAHRTMDSKTACDIIDQIFQAVDSPIWVPQYHFALNNIFQLLNRGMSPEQIKQFLRIFNNGIRQKIQDPNETEIRTELVRQLKEIQAAQPVPNQKKAIEVEKSEIHQVYTTAPRQSIDNLDMLPFPDRTLVNYEKYNRFIGHANAKHCMTLHTTRGCPYHCLYCHKIWPKKHVFRSAENIFEEVMIYYNLGIRRIAIQDDVFNYNRKNSRRFLNLIIKHGLDIHLFFETGLRGDILTRDYIDLMVEAGTINLTLALETASHRLQKLIRKKMNLDKLRENLEYFCSAFPNVILGLQTMVGFPTETEAEALMTLDFIKSIRWLHFPYVHILKIFPNTDMEKLVLEHGISKETIYRSQKLAYQELPETLPFSKSFAFKYQGECLHQYFLLKERLLHVLPYQLKVLTRDEILQKYNSYLPTRVENFTGLLESFGIKEEELNGVSYLEDDYMYVPELNEKLRNVFPVKKPGENSLRILLIDLTLFFSSKKEIIYDIAEPPIGLMMLMSYLNRELGDMIHGKIAKSRIDFDSYEELQEMVEVFKPQIIGIRTLTYFKDFFHNTVAMIRQWGFDGPVVAGGPYATSDYNNLLQDRNIDLAVLGEGEITFTELVKKIIEEKGKLPEVEILEKIDGISFIPLRPGRQKEKAIAHCFKDSLENE